MENIFNFNEDLDLDLGLGGEINLEAEMQQITKGIKDAKKELLACEMLALNIDKAAIMQEAYVLENDEVEEGIFAESELLEDLKGIKDKSKAMKNAFVEWVKQVIAKVSLSIKKLFASAKRLKQIEQNFASAVNKATHIKDLNYTEKSGSDLLAGLKIAGNSLNAIKTTLSVKKDYAPVVEKLKDAKRALEAAAAEGKKGTLYTFDTVKASADVIKEGQGIINCLNASIKAAKEAKDSSNIASFRTATTLTLQIMSGTMSVILDTARKKAKVASRGKKEDK